MQIQAGVPGASGLVVSYLSASYTRDALEQVTSETPQSYGYDADNRLTSGGTGGGTGYAYNADDTLKTITGGGATTAYTYDVGQQLQTAVTTPLVGPATTVSYGYDRNGNRTGSGSSVYGWDQGNRLTSAAGAGYGYDGDGLRQSKTLAGSTAQYTWDVASGLPVILSEGTKSYVTGADGLPLEEITGAVVRYLYQDQLGSTRALSDANGVLSASMTYDAYGNLLTSTGSDLGTFRFAGQQLDPETGFYYLRARYYDPATAQFISRDPMVPITRESYVYVLDSPLNRTDPAGLWTVGLCHGISLGLSGGGFAQDCFVADSEGSFGTTHTIGGGGQTPTANLNTGIQVSTAKCNKDLEGPFAYGGAGGAAGLIGGSVTGSVGSSRDGAVVVGDANISGGPSIPVDLHGGVSTTSYTDWKQPAVNAWNWITSRF